MVTLVLLLIVVFIAMNPGFVILNCKTLNANINQFLNCNTFILLCEPGSYLSFFTSFLSPPKIERTIWEIERTTSGNRKDDFSLAAMEEFIHQKNIY
jgi:hypothetical protein